MEVYFIDLEDEHSIAFFPNSGRFFKTNKNGKELIGNIAEGKKFEDLSKSVEINREQYADYIAQIEKYDITLEEEKKPERKGSFLERLVIHVANDCNLRCRYCYACGGSYGSSRAILEPQMLKITLEKFFGRFYEIGNVQIFGGEPLYNLPAIKEICEYVDNINKIRNTKTKIGLVTNATMITDEFIDVVKKYGINVTVSYDGNRKVNDITRIYASGRGSSDDILERTHRLYEATGQPNTIEVTYTQYHVDNKVKITEIVKELKKEFPKTYVHLVAVCGEKTDDYTLKDYGVFGESVDELFEMSKNGENYSYSMLERIITGIANHKRSSGVICNAGVGTLSVSVNGDVYPCFMFTDQEALKLGNVNDENLFDSLLLKERLEKLYEFNSKEKNPACSKCFMRALCNGCLGLNAVHTGDKFELNNDICDMFRDMTRRAIIQCVNSNVMAEVKD